MANKFETLWWRVMQEIPSAKIVLKGESRFISLVFKVLGVVVKVITLGKGSTDWSNYVTTIGGTMYVPDDFYKWSDLSKYSLLRHELMHMRQFRNWPFKFLNRKGFWRINQVIMSFCYLATLPVFWTMRAKFEKEGYTQSLLTDYENLSPTVWSARKEYYVNWMANIFGTSSYFFMSSKDRAKKWTRETIAKIEAGEIVNEKDRV